VSAGIYGEDALNHVATGSDSEAFYAPYGWLLMPYEYEFIVTDFTTKTINYLSELP
jgi:hypothetical protein